MGNGPPMVAEWYTAKGWTLSYRIAHLRSAQTKIISVSRNPLLLSSSSLWFGASSSKQHNVSSAPELLESPAGESPQHPGESYFSPLPNSSRGKVQVCNPFLSLHPHLFSGLLCVYSLRSFICFVGENMNLRFEWLLKIRIPSK